MISKVETLVAARGHKCIFVPKHHSELNLNECVWGHAKQYTRSHCDYTFAGLEQTIEPALDIVLTSGRLGNMQGGIGKVLQLVQNLRMPWKKIHVSLVYFRNHEIFSWSCDISLSSQKRKTPHIFYADETSKIGFTAAQQKNSRITSRKKLQLKS